MIDFPFKYPENQATLVCKHVIEGTEDITFVTHDIDDGMWQFLCNRRHDAISEVLLVGLSVPYEIDKSISELADMDAGYLAVRKAKGSNWIISRKK